jgi:hypothetical protein
MNEELCRERHGTLGDRIDRLEAEVSALKEPEDGTLAKMRRGFEQSTEKVESKLNWLITFIMTTVVGILVTITASKLGVK